MKGLAKWHDAVGEALYFRSQYHHEAALCDGTQQYLPCCTGYPGFYNYDIQLAVWCICGCTCGDRCWDVTVKSEIILGQS